MGIVTTIKCRGGGAGANYRAHHAQLKAPRLLNCLFRFFLQLFGSPGHNSNYIQAYFIQYAFWLIPEALTLCVSLNTSSLSA